MRLRHWLQRYTGGSVGGSGLSTATLRLSRKCFVDETNLIKVKIVQDYDDPLRKLQFFFQSRSLVRLSTQRSDTKIKRQTTSDTSNDIYIIQCWIVTTFNTEVINVNLRVIFSLSLSSSLSLSNACSNSHACVLFVCLKVKSSSLSVETIIHNFLILVPFYSFQFQS